MKKALILLVIFIAFPVLGKASFAQLNFSKQLVRSTSEDNNDQSFDGEVIDRVEREGARIQNFVDEPDTSESSSTTNDSFNRVVVMDDSETVSDGESIVRGNDNEVNVKRNVEIVEDGRPKRMRPIPSTDDRGFRVNQKNIIIPSH